jgi:hypothetical protein
VIEVNRKILLIVLALAVILMATPYIGMVQAYGRQDDHKLYFKLYLEGVTKGPPAKGPWVTSDGFTHIRGLPWIVTGAFEVWIGNAAPISLPPTAYSGYLDLDISPTGFITLSVHEKITFAGGTLKIVTAETMQGESGGGTFFGQGTGALDDAKLKGTSAAVSISGVNYITREGTVRDWPHLVHASMTSQSITYDELTAMCLAAGLSKNPYPAPTIPTVVGPDENFMLYVYDLPAYFTFSLTIGCKTYTGISCDHGDFAWNVTTNEATMKYHPTWYLGKLGCMHNGFAGTADMKLFGYYNNGEGDEGYDHYVVAFLLHGFGHFKGQGLWLADDSSLTDIATGNIFAWGHRC